MKVKNYLILLLCLLLCISMCVLPAFAAESLSEGNNTSIETLNISKETDSLVIDKAKSWMQENYQDVYFLRNITAKIVRVFDAGEEIKYTVAMSCEHKYRCNDVNGIPFVKGMLNEIKAKDLKENERKAINDYIDEIREDANFGEYNKLNVDIIIVVNKHNPDIPWKMYYSDGVGTAIYDISIMKPDSNELYKQGEEAARSIIKNASTDVTRGYSAYDRLAARDYSRSYTSNATSCSQHGSSCGVLQDHTKWNNADYPYSASIFAHNDCANFVSQAMSKGGIPEVVSSSGWYRTKGTLNYSSSWTTVSGLKSYMTASSRNYWDSSTFTNCNRGNIILTSTSHVVMVDSFDGSTHKFNGHTNDRYQYPYYRTSGFTYYVINRT